MDAKDKITIVVVSDGDDSWYSPGLLKIIASNDEYQLLAHFTDARITLTKCPQLAPNVVIIDPNVQPLGGIELLKLLLKSQVKSRYIIATNGDADTISAAMQLGVRYFLYKPYDKDNVDLTIQKILSYPV
jgi:DNA-binding NarL/FixJ family response regulator